MRLTLTRDLQEFAERGEIFLAARPERNVMASVLTILKDGASFGTAEPLFAYTLDGDRVVAAAIRTPPWPLIATKFGRPEQAVELMRAWLEEDSEVRGVNAETRTARAIASAWAVLTGGATHRRMLEAMHALTVVKQPPRPALGSLRAAGEDDRELLIGWERAFVAEARVGIPGLAREVVDRRLASGAQYLWDHGGPVATVAVSPTIAGTGRIGPVYTPPAYRCHGYATSAVAAASNRLLSNGARRCMLFTDLTNPTSNKIYASIGFQRFAGWEEHAFVAPATVDAERAHKLRH